MYDYFKPFKGQFKGKYYDLPLMPNMIFENNKICLKFQDFISNCILGRVSNGSLSIWGKKENVSHLLWLCR